ncbi:MAG: metalloregulator ArsR/SmtB family transcription factor [Candidatus Marinimicrobia bacterium]|nr:metalloregulator ArsR/SmtB family transcription factor [Candidatus Neomarinimicrobiota bacterium]MDD4960870.1 metalloregulator ArsR/SmtB family transcription factor [Candidatus Neomarinimicrobiota bacterium]
MIDERVEAMEMSQEHAKKDIPPAEVTQELVEFMKILAEPNRLRIVQYMYLNSEHCVTKLAELIGITQPATSQHLKLLRQSGVLSSRKDGRMILYSLDRDSIMQRYGNGIRHIKQFFGKDTVAPSKH